MFLTLLEDTGNPVIVANALTVPEVVEDETEVLYHLAAAPAVMNYQDLAGLLCEWNRRMSAPLLLASLLEHWRRLGRLLLHDAHVTAPETEVVDSLRQELSCGMDRAVDVLLTREDGIALVCTWALHLARSLAHLPWSMPLVVEDAALRALARVFNERGINEARLRRETGRDDDSGLGVDLLLVLLTMAHESVYAQTGTVESGGALRPDDQRLMALFRQRLHQGDPDLSLYRDTNPPSLAHAYMAFLIVQSSDPVETWRQIWSELAEQRRAMFYRRYESDNVFDDPSLFVLYTGIAALEWFASGEDVMRTTTLLCLWDELLKAVLAVVLRLGPFSRPWPRATTWRNVVFVLATLLPHLPPQGKGDTRLRDLLYRLGGDDELIIQCVAFLYRNGMRVDELNEALSQANIDLDATMARYADAYREEKMPRAVGGQPSALDDCRALRQVVDSERAALPR